MPRAKELRRQRVEVLQSPVKSTLCTTPCPVSARREALGISARPAQRQVTSHRAHLRCAQRATLDADVLPLKVEPTSEVLPALAAWGMRSSSVAPGMTAENSGDKGGRSLAQIPKRSCPTTMGARLAASCHRGHASLDTAGVTLATPSPALRVGLRSHLSELSDDCLTNTSITAAGVVPTLRNPCIVPRSMKNACPGSARCGLPDPIVISS